MAWRRIDEKQFGSRPSHYLTNWWLIVDWTPVANLIKIWYQTVSYKKLLKTRSCHNANFIVTFGTDGCHNDNFQYHQCRQKCRQCLIEGNTLKPKSDGHYIVDDIFKYISSKKKRFK